MSHLNIILSHMYRYFNLFLAFGCQATLFMYVCNFTHAASSASLYIFMFSLNHLLQIINYEIMKSLLSVWLLSS